jgi:hypothetical protein
LSSELNRNSFACELRSFLTDFFSLHYQPESTPRQMGRALQ